MVYARKQGNQELTFDFSEALFNNNLLIVDRETRSTWSQMEGKAIRGPLKGEPLTMVPALQTTWKYWRTLHPDTRALIIEGARGVEYRYTSRAWRISQGSLHPGGHNTADLGLGVAIGDEAMFFHFRELNRTRTPFTIELGGKRITIHYRRDALTAWAEDAEGHLLPGVLAYERGWLGFNPDTRIFQAAR